MCSCRNLQGTSTPPPFGLVRHPYTFRNKLAPPRACRNGTDTCPIGQKCNLSSDDGPELAQTSSPVRDTSPWWSHSTERKKVLPEVCRINPNTTSRDPKRTDFLTPDRNLTQTSAKIREDLTPDRNLTQTSTRVRSDPSHWSFPGHTVQPLRSERRRSQNKRFSLAMCRIHRTPTPIGE